jgi:broad specificity phosphatase PhoE
MPFSRINAFSSLFGALLLLVLAGPVGAQQAMVAEEIDFIRHGQSEDNLDAGQPVVSLSGKIAPSRGKILSGWNAASLTMQGVSEAVKAGESLKAHDSDAVLPLKDAKWVYSPLLRTQQTLAGVMVGAGIADDKTMLSATPDPRLFERSAGMVTNLTWEEAGAIWPEMKKGRDAQIFTDANFGYPNGESLSDVYRRSADAINDYAQTNKRIVFVSHELTIKAMLAYLLDGKIDNAAFKYKVENAKPITLRRVDGKWVMDH